MIETDSRTHGTPALKPHNLTHEQATAAACGGLLARQYVDKGAIQPGQDVLIYGASGTSGTMAIQYAKSLGAHVTAVCSTKNLDLVRSSAPTRSWTTPASTPRPRARATHSSWTPSAA